MNMIIKRFVQQLKINLSMDFWKTLISTLGAVSAVVTLISFVFQVQSPCTLVIVIYFFIVIGGSLLISWLLTRRKDSLKLKLSNTLTVNVNAGDLFDFASSTNYVVIPVNEYFDTVVNTKIVSPFSLHGQFINKHYGYHHPDLHEQIESYLTKNNVEYIEVSNRPNEGGYNKKYPLGTCVPVQVGQVTYVLVALTHFDDEDHAYVELSEFGRCISSVCRFIAKHAGNKPTYMPLMGMGLSRLNQTGQFILKYTLDTIVGVKELAIPGGLNIVVYPPIAKTLNLNAIKYN